MMQRIALLCIVSAALLLQLCCKAQELSPPPWNCTFASPNKTQLVCEGSNVTSLPLHASDLPRDVERSSIRSLSVTAPSLIDIPDSSFPFPYLAELRLTSGRISRVSSHAFGSVGSGLVLLDLSDNELRAVPVDALANVARLHSFLLSGNDITSLEAIDFAYFTELSHLDLSRNSIHSIDEGTFECLQKLTSLDLSDNQLGTFDSRTLGLDRCDSPLPSRNFLESLWLRRNELSGSDLVIDLSHLKLLDLSQNAIRRLQEEWFQNLIELRTLNLSDCSIGYLDAYVFSPMAKLERLDLSKNAISILHADAFGGLMSLRDLDVSENELTYLNVNHTDDLSSLERVSFRGNSMEYVFPGVFQNSLQLSAIDMTGNPLECSCQLYDFAQFLKARPLSNSSVSSAVCQDSDTPITEFDFGPLNCQAETTTAIQLETTSASVSSTAASAVPTKFDTYIQILEFKHTDHELNLTWSGHGLHSSRAALDCSVHVGIPGSPYVYNSTEGCPVDGENRTAEITSITGGHEYEVCLVASLVKITLLRNCTRFNATLLARESEGTTTAVEIDSTIVETNWTTAVMTTVSSPAETTTTSFAAMQTTVPSWEAKNETSTTSLTSPSDTTTVIKTDSTTMLPSETEKPMIITGFRGQSRPVFVVVSTRQDHLKVTWTGRDVASPCRFNISVTKNGAIFARSEVPCSPKGHISFDLSDSCNDYGVCFASEHLHLVDECHEVIAAKSESRCGEGAGNLAPVSSTGGEGVGLPVSLIIVLAALVLTVLIVVIVVVCRRRRARVVRRKKNDGDSLQLQINRRSGSYAVSVVEQQRGIYQSANCQTFGKVSQRASSVDEL